MEYLSNRSVIGRLLEEISWEGSSVRAYRDGGRGRENVLTAEVLLPLSYLPRSDFFGEVLRSAHGAEAVCARAAEEIEQAEITLLPDDIVLPPNGIVVQPDATLVTPSCHVLLEAKRIRRAAFQREQLPREYLSLLRDAGPRQPLLLLVLGAPPPVTVRGSGRLDLEDAVTRHLETVYAKTDGVSASLDELIDRLPDVIAWITWEEIRETVVRKADQHQDLDSGMAGTLQRLCDAVTTAIDWHA